MSFKSRKTSPLSFTTRRRQIIPLHLENFSRLIDKYDYFLVDIHGVIHDGITGFPCAIECINELVEYKPVIFLSNNPRPNNFIKEKILSLGISSEVKVYTSGDVALQILEKDFIAKKIYHLGSDRNQELTAYTHLKLVTHVAEADLVLLTLFLYHIDEFENYHEIIEEIISKKVNIICPNPDKIAPHGHFNRICAGALAELMKKRGLNVYYIGKPQVNIYDYIVQKELNLFSKPNIKGLMIGDTLEIDIKFATKIGLDSMLVLSGITGQKARRTKSFLSYLSSVPDDLWPQFYAPCLCW